MFYNISDVSPPQSEHFGEFYKTSLQVCAFSFVAFCQKLNTVPFGEKISSFIVNK